MPNSFISTSTTSICINPAVSKLSRSAPTAGCPLDKLPLHRGLAIPKRLLRSLHMPPQPHNVHLGLRTGKRNSPCPKPSRAPYFQVPPCLRDSICARESGTVHGCWAFDSSKVVTCEKPGRRGGGCLHLQQHRYPKDLGYDPRDHR